MNAQERKRNADHKERWAFLRRDGGTCVDGPRHAAERRRRAVAWASDGAGDNSVCRSRGLSLSIVAICLLGTEVSRYFIHLAKNALRAVVDRRFRAGGAMCLIFDKCFLIFSVAERHLDRVHRLVERCTRLMRRAPRNHGLAGFHS